ncbi:MAG: hypothetical protein M1539_02365 [Actinobacteria bacterium]|nr:hypothetical protein [Actinomycetota bacterium]MCL5882810.1 hypothetical protein [Actinomycetota bacterium]
MKVRIIVIGLLLVVSMLAFASVASAQSACSAVDVTPLSGNAGSSVYASGTTLADSTIQVEWDGATGVFPDISTDVSTGEFGVNLTIPADATPGEHTITLLLPSEASCPFTFTVEAVVTPPTAAAPAAAVPAPATLPNTGFFLIVPAAGLVAAGMGGLMFRRHSNH